MRSVNTEIPFSIFFPHERLGVWQDFMKMQICACGKKERGRVKNEEASRQMRGVMRSVNPPPDHRCVEKTKEKMKEEVQMWFLSFHIANHLGHQNLLFRYWNGCCFQTWIGMIMFDIIFLALERSWISSIKRGYLCLSVILVGGDGMISLREWTHFFRGREPPISVVISRKWNNHQRNGSKIVCLTYFSLEPWLVYNLKRTPREFWEWVASLFECTVNSQNIKWKQSTQKVPVWNPKCVSWPNIISKNCIRSNVDIPPPA